MQNYHYIIAGLPELVLNADNKAFSYQELREHIYHSSDEKDRRFIEWLEFGSKEENLTSVFYAKALKCKNRFIRLYFALDLEIRNRKVDFVSNKMSKEGENYKVQVKDGVDLNLSEQQLQKLTEIFANKNILEKEQQLDKFKWDYINELNPYGTFNMDVILAFLAKGQLIERWNKLDKATGEQMFRTLVDEVRGTFKGIENKILE